MNHFSSTVSTIVGQKRRSEGYLLVLLVHGFLVLRESRRSLSVEPVQVVTLCAKVTCTGINGVEIMTRVPRRHGDRHGESKDTSTKISNNTSLSTVLIIRGGLGEMGGRGKSRADMTDHITIIEIQSTLKSSLKFSIKLKKVILNKKR